MIYDFTVKVDGSAPLMGTMSSDEEPTNQRIKEAAATELNTSAELIEVVDCEAHQ